LWERECSLQRRFQKVVEIAPSSVRDRGVVGRVVEAAVRMAEKVSFGLFWCWRLRKVADSRHHRFDTSPWGRSSSY
jgi:biotin carboxylase